jgi:hypothetical protein
MKMHVITDRDGTIIAAASAEVVGPYGATVTIHPQHESHSLHQIDTADDIFQLDSDEFTNRLKQHLRKK